MALLNYTTLLESLETAHWSTGKIKKFIAYCKKKKLVTSNLIDTKAARKAVIALEKANPNPRTHATKK